MDYEVKNLQKFLAEDRSLTEKMTYEQFQSKETAPNNSDDAIDAAYKGYCDALKKL